MRHGWHIRMGFVVRVPWLCEWDWPIIDIGDTADPKYRGMATTGMATIGMGDDRLLPGVCSVVVLSMAAS